VGCDSEDVLPHAILEGEPMFSRVLNTSSGPMKVLGVCKVSSCWGLPFTLLPLELLDVLITPSILKLPINYK
jgi:hypothetical protein